MKKNELQAADPFEFLRPKIKRTLVDFSPDLPETFHSEIFEARKPNEDKFPVPDLVAMLLRTIMGYQSSMRGEKVAWSIYAMVTAEPVIFEMRKFGFVILQKKGSSLKLERIEGQLLDALKILEKTLKSFGDKQITEGNVTIVNRFSEFSHRYLFFRDLANRGYAACGVADLKTEESGLPQMASVLNRRARKQRQGFFHSVAMIDAYFSHLEHRLILLRAFTGKSLEEDGFQNLLAAKWDEKLKNLVEVGNDRNAGLILGLLRKIRLFSKICG